MIRKAVLATILVAATALAGYAADGDNAAPPAREGGASPPGSPSFFEGVWAGSIRFHRDATASQDVTITIGGKGGRGFHPVEYSWGTVSLHNKIIQGGSIRTKGRDEGDRFVFNWRNKQGRDFEATLRRQADGAVAFRIEKSGPYESGEMPYNEGSVKRK